MPRVYKPLGKRQYKKYDELIIQAALSEYERTNSSLATISAKHNIPKSVLHRHNTRFMKKQGGQTVLSVEAENYIIENLNHCSEWGYPLDTFDLRILVKGYLDRIGVSVKKFKENLPGPDFVKSFLKRNKSKISLRISQNIKRARASVSPEITEAYFEELKKSLDGVPEQNIINYDETNLSDDPGRRKVITKRGAKYPERVMNHSKGSTSLMMAASADGKLLPCYVVYKSKHLYETWVKQGPKDCRYNCTKSGWFDSNTFEDWVRTIAIPFFEGKSGKKILIGDNLSSHLSLDLIRECKEKDIHFIFLPANSTHLTQPLDVAFFRPTKGAWRDILFKWKKTEGRTLASIPKSVFPRLLNDLLVRIESQVPANILAGFKKAGISPLNKNKVLERLPGNTTNKDEDLNKGAIDQSVLDLLKVMRYGTGGSKINNKRKKINVKPGQSVAEIESTGISGRDSNEERSGYNSNKSDLSDLEQPFEPPEIIMTENNANSTLNKKIKPTHLIAKQIPEDRKKIFEAKYSTDFSKKETNKEPAQNLPKDVFKKPRNIKYKKNTIKTTLTQVEDVEKDVFLAVKSNIDDCQLAGTEEWDIGCMPIFFEDNFCIENEIEIGQNVVEDNKENSKNESNATHKNEEFTNRTTKSEKIKVTSVENFENKKVVIDLKQNKKIALTSELLPKPNKKKTKYYAKDEDIIRDLLKDDV